MAFEKLVEEKIREAMANGEFDNLPCAGSPINLDDYFSAPEDIRLTYSVLKSAGILPREAELLKEADSLKEQADRARTEDERNRLIRQAGEKRLEYELIMDRYRRGRRSQK